MSVAPHVAPETLFAYEAGALTGGWALAVASHLSMCPHCRAQARLPRAVGGVMLEALEPAVMEHGSLDVMFRRIGDEGVDIPRVRASQKGPIPLPLQSHVGADVDAMPWRRLGLTAHQVWIETGDRTTRARLLRVPAGVSMPIHSHRGGEMTLALIGSVHSVDGVLNPGDIEEADETTVHQPTAGTDSECICLAVTGAPLRFKSWAMRIVQPFLRI